jgi:hypothetical protein
MQLRGVTLCFLFFSLATGLTTTNVNRPIMPLLLWNRSIVYQVSSVGLLIALFVGRVDCYEALAQ